MVVVLVENFVAQNVSETQNLKLDFITPQPPVFILDRAASATVCPSVKLSQYSQLVRAYVRSSSRASVSSLSSLSDCVPAIVPIGRQHTYTHCVCVTHTRTKETGSHWKRTIAAGWLAGWQASKSATIYTRGSAEY